MKKLLTTIFLCLPAATVMANMEYNGNASYTSNENISNAVNDRDIFDDTFLSVNFDISKLWVPAVGKSVLLGGHLGTESYNHAEGLNRTSYGASLTYIQKLGLGAYTPRISLFIQSDKRDYKTDMRDGWLHRVGISLERRFTPEFHAGVTLASEKRTADPDKAIPYHPGAPSDVYNQNNNELAVSADYTLVNNSVITARYLYRDGEIDASTNPGSEFFGNSKAIAQDHYLCKTCSYYVAYLSDASTHSFMLDWNWALGRDTSVSANIERNIAHVQGGVSYSGNLFKLQLNQRF